MFQDDIRIYGKHAYYMQLLSPREREYNDTRIFNRYIDVYMVGAVVGFIYGEKAPKDTTSEYKSISSNMPLTTINREKDNLMLIYRTIMLLENKDKTPKERRIDRAFKDDLFEERSMKKAENDELFNSYMRGGIEFLYQNLYHETLTTEERIKKIMDFVKLFHADYYEKAYLQDIDYEKDRV